uniref:Uncharacterized protein n=1 Tax=Arundo donax TaxID=35708 RepID=A0A0A9F3A6_ARUDO
MRRSPHEGVLASWGVCGLFITRN